MGGAHHDHIAAAGNLKRQVIKHLTELETYDKETLLKKRYDKFRSFGEFRERGRR